MVGLSLKEMPRNTQLRCVQCCTCHAKRDFAAPSAATATQKRNRGASSAAPARKNEPEVLQVLHLRQRKTRRRPKASLVARLPPTSMKVLQVLRLPRETSPRCSKCSACHAKRGGAQKHHSSPDFRRPL